MFFYNHRVIIYYRNCVATFNYLELSIQLSGDVHPLPGPEIGRRIPVQITQQRPTQPTRTFSRDPSNHTQVKTTWNLQHSLTAPFQLSLLNVRSIREKGLIVKDFTVEHDLDALIITETWLRPGNPDAIALGTLCSCGYHFCMSLESLKLLEVGLDSYLKNPLLLILTFVRPSNHLS